MTCPNQPGCGLADDLRTAPVFRVWQILYCESGFQRCERLKLLRSGRMVPANLLPNGRSLGALAARPAAGAAKRP